jgi:hypothetical protein
MEGRMREFLEIAAQQLWRLTVVWPAWLLTPEGTRHLLSRRGLRRLALFALMVGLTFAVSQVMPWGVSLIYAGDLVTYLDLTAVAWLLSASGQIRHVVRAARGRPRLRRSPIRRARAGHRTSRTAAGRRASPPANEDEPARPPVAA